MDTIDANLHLGHEIDARDWSDAIAIVRALGIKELTLLTNNPNKVQALRDAGVEVTQANLTVAANSFNEKYLATKEEKLGHLRGGQVNGRTCTSNWNQATSQRQGRDHLFLVASRYL
jgi:3,4-dihydroxy 2-butanone 4-phosphate synthase/GTP cyclohydrolase II